MDVSFPRPLGSQGRRILGAFLAVCPSWACSEAEDPIAPDDPPGAVVSRYDSASDRLISMLDRGMVVSRYQDGSTEHEGDSLIFSGLGMAALSCDDGQAIEGAILDMMERLDGGLARHWSKMDKVSLDGAIGVYRGVSERFKRCDGSKERWAGALERHLKSSTINPQTDVDWGPGFRYVPELLLANATGGEPPSDKRLAELARNINVWAASVMASKAACFRLNLGYQTFMTIEAVGASLPGSTRDDFCTITNGSRIATIDAWCGRESLVPWIDAFQFDRWGYAHQRCPGWESPDGRPGLSEPAVDLLEALGKAYKLPQWEFR